MANVVTDRIDQNPPLKKTYARLLKAVGKVGKVSVEVKKTSVHLVAKSGFAGVHVRKDHLIIQIVGDHPIESERVFNVEQVSKRRYHNHIRLYGERDVDDKLLDWLSDAFELMS